MIPDLALQTTLVTGLRELKRDRRRIEALFANLPTQIRVQVCDFLEKTPIHFSHGYPFETPKLPHIVLVLRREDESSPLLGQVIDGGPIAEEELVLRSGDVGRMRPPLRDDPTVADALLEARTRDFPDESVPLLYGDHDQVETSGRIERLVYDAEVRTLDYFATAFLCRVIKSIAIDRAGELESWGVHDLQLSASDLQYTGQEVPHPVFTRLLTLTFQYVFTVHDVRHPLRGIEGQLTASSAEAAATTLSWQVTIA
jgi:hypothetical protein